jgi:hypothetical protein
MHEASLYIVERNAWSIVGHCDVHFRLTYERVFLPVQDLLAGFSSPLRGNRFGPLKLVAPAFRRLVGRF